MNMKYFHLILTNLFHLFLIAFCIRKMKLFQLISMEIVVFEASTNETVLLVYVLELSLGAY